MNDFAMSDFELAQRFWFDAAHTLDRTIETEASRRIHGHTYHAELHLTGTPDPDTGMVVDLGRVRQELQRVRELLDHRLLDEIDGLGHPTLENLCRFIHAQVRDVLPGVVAVLVERRAIGDRCVMRVAPAAAPGTAGPRQGRSSERSRAI